MQCPTCHNNHGFTTRIVKGKSDAYQCNFCGHMWAKPLSDDFDSIFPGVFSKK